VEEGDGLSIEHVGYKGSAPMITDLIGGSLSFVRHAPAERAASSPEAPSDRVTRARAAIAPDVPTVVEEGMPYLVAENFIGISGPAGLPAPVVTRLHAAIQASLDDPNFVKRMNDLGFAIRKMSTAEFQAFVHEQVTGWAPAVKASGRELNKRASSAPSGARRSPAKSAAGGQRRPRPAYFPACGFFAITTSQGPRASMNITQSWPPSHRAACLALPVKAKYDPGGRRCSLPSTTRIRSPVTVVT
jgi:hypothetical protein